MIKRRFLVFVCVMLAVAVLAWGVDQSWAQTANGDKFRSTKPTAAEKKAAAKRAKDLGLSLGAAALGVPAPGDIDGPGGIPHYFGPYGNWAFSPLPKGSIGSITVDNPGSGYTAPVITIDDVYGTGACRLATYTLGPNNGIASITMDVTNSTGGTGYTNPVVTIRDNPALCGILPQAVCGTGASYTATLVNGAIAGFTMVSQGSGYKNPIVTITDPTGTCATATATVDASGAISSVTLASNVPVTTYSAPVVTITDPTGVNAAATANLTGLSGGIAKFVDPLPGLYDPRSGPLPDGDKAIPLGVPDVVTYPGSDYYEIALKEYSEKMHSSLDATKLRGYVQTNSGTANVYDPTTNPAGCVRPGDPLPTAAHQYCVAGNNTVRPPTKPHYLGPVIVAKGRVQGIEDTKPEGKPVPVRIRFFNQLPTDAGGDLFIPVDETVTGSGIGPSVQGSKPGDKYTQNRAAVHLHGNNTVWISDGNVHQWITPANQITPYPAGVSARNVPDMDGCASDPLNPLLPGSSGCMTLFYTNAQSARLQFYHDHSMGITRLNVYAGEAGGYLITDAAEQDMIKGTNVSGVSITPAGGDCLADSTTCAKVLPPDNFGLGIPLIIQDKTFVDKDTIFAQDPTWNWGTGTRFPPSDPDPAKRGKIQSGVTGDLWYPHVYMTVQNPWDLTGTNALGRWHYGPWFNPPTPVCVNGGPVGCIEVGAISNEYYQPICDGLPDSVNTVCTAPWEPPMRPGLPNPSIPGSGAKGVPVPRPECV